MDLVFEWNETKADLNLKRHKVSFDEAKTVYYDPFLLTFPDPFHSDEEDRYLNLGRSYMGQILVVIHTQRDEAIRIISARKATRSEQRAYEEGDYDDYE